MNTSSTAKIELALNSIQPIRDLSRNWDVDIASCLEEYLREIVGELAPGVCVGEYDANGTNNNDTSTSLVSPNFAQAALLLHNSSNVYGRKVEYLYKLVYDALQNLVTSAAASNKSNNRTKKVDGEIEEFEDFDEQLQFLLLDNVIPTDKKRKKIDLPVSAAATAQNANSMLEFPRSASRLSLGGTMMATTIDRSAAASAATMKLLTASDGTLCILSQQTESNQDGLFRMRGTAFLVETDKSPQKTASFAGNGIKDGGGIALITAMDDAENDDKDITDKFTNETMMMDEDPPAPVDEDHPMSIDENLYDIDDDNDGPGYKMSIDNDKNNISSQPEHVVKHARKNVTLNIPFLPCRPDPWKLLDPHEEGSKKGRPIRVGKTYQFPAGLAELPSECVTGARTKQTNKNRESYQLVNKIEPSEPVHIATAAFRNAVSRMTRTNLDDSIDKSFIEPPTPMSIPLNKSLVFGEEFAYIMKANAKLKAAERRKRRKLLQTNPVPVAPQKEDDEIMGYDDGGFDYGGDNESYGGDDGNVDFQDENNNSGASSLGFDVINSDASTFESLCRAHIQEFRKGAEKFKAETNLVKRVGDWQNSLSPLLAEEARRPEFNFQLYEENVMKSICKAVDQTNGTTREATFQNVTEKKEKFEVCRLFLATLKLCDRRNINIKAEEGTVMTPETLKLELLKSNVDRPMRVNLAPSAREDNDSDES